MSSDKKYSEDCQPNPWLLCYKLECIYHKKTIKEML